MVVEYGGLERHLDDLRLAVGVGGEVEHTRARRAQREVHLAVSRDARDVEALDIARASLAVAIYHIINGALVVLLEHTQPDDVLAHEELFGHTHHLELTITIEDDDIVDVRAVAHKLVLLQSCADEALVAVDVEFLVGLGHLAGLDGVEVANLGESLMVLAILVLEELEPRCRHLGEVGQVAVYLVDLGLDASHQLVGLLLVELQDALHLDFQESQDVVFGHLAHQLRIVRCQSVVDMLADGIDGRCLFEFLILIDALLDEDFLQ